MARDYYQGPIPVAGKSVADRMREKRIEAERARRIERLRKRGIGHTRVDRNVYENGEPVPCIGPSKQPAVKELDTRKRIA